MRAIREQDPVWLGRINRAYRGDIEVIVAKALEKDKSRRYDSAADLAADIRRYLHDGAATAHAPSGVYQLRKLAKRHKTAVAAVATVFLVLIAAVIVSAWQVARARQAEQTAMAISNFLRDDLLAQASVLKQASGTKLDPDLKVRTALDRAAAAIAGRFNSQPLVEAAIRHTMGESYRGLGLYKEAQEQLERAVDMKTTA